MIGFSPFVSSPLVALFCFLPQVVPASRQCVSVQFDGETSTAFAVKQLAYLQLLVHMDRTSI